MDEKQDDEQSKAEQELETGKKHSISPHDYDFNLGKFKRHHIPSIVNIADCIIPLSDQIRNPMLESIWSSSIYRDLDTSSERIKTYLYLDTQEEKLRQEVHKAREELSRVKSDLNKQLIELRQKAESRDELVDEYANLNEQLKRLSESHEHLEKKQSLSSLLQQVHPDHAQRLIDDLEFQAKFLESAGCKGYVMSVDIRRSTELMLKARRSLEFASFLSDLCLKLRQVVLEHDGVFDKFTGDGVLAFFPDFYSGESAGKKVLDAAQKCHQVFDKHYRSHRGAFLSVLKDAGLGIGIDFGDLNLVRISGAVTVVGPPVVYACRLGGAPAGETLVNHPAYSEIQKKFSRYFSFNETSLNFKHEGNILAYSVVPVNGKVEEEED